MWYPSPAAARLHHDRELRALYVSVGVSILLHAAAMFVFPGLRFASVPAEPTALTALFASPAEVKAAPDSPRNARRRREPEPVPLHKVPDAIPVAAPEVEPAPPQPQAPDSGASPVAAASAAPAAREQPTAPAAETFDPGLFDAYRLALIDEAKRYKRYPPRAVERGWEGRVEIRVTVDANGTIKSAAVKSSSRYQILDDQALEMVRKALAQVRPAPLGREFTVDVPVVFELQNG
jgi:protein TonB